MHTCVQPEFNMSSPMCSFSCSIYGRRSLNLRFPGSLSAQMEVWRHMSHGEANDSIWPLCLLPNGFVPVVPPALEWPGCTTAPLPRKLDHPNITKLLHVQLGCHGRVTVVAKLSFGTVDEATALPKAWSLTWCMTPPQLDLQSISHN